jgi:hypothetical protein
MKVTLKFDGKSITVNPQSGFELFVDDELLLSHEGDQEEEGYETVKALYAQEKTCCGGKCCDKDAGYADVGYGKESLFDTSKPEIQDAYKRLQAALASIRSSEVINEDSKPEKAIYHAKKVENSSFITQIRWWNWEESLGTDALEVSLTDGRILNYGDVPFSVYAAWVKEIVSGGSAGRFYNKHIKGTYEMISELNLDDGYEGEDEGEDE